jgi:hypothetical protein
MRFLSIPLVAVVLFAVVIAAGCTQAPGPAAPAVPAAPPAPSAGTVTGSDLPSLALGPADLPPCYTVSDRRAKTTADVGDLAKNAGWEAGYEAVFTCPSGTGESTVIVHTLALYPAHNVPAIAGMVDRQDRPAGYQCENITDPDQRCFVSGFFAVFNGTMDTAASPGLAVLGGKNTSADGSGAAGEFAEFIVFRGKVFEVLRMTGPETNATVLHDLARTAAQKIP